MNGGGTRRAFIGAGLAAAAGVGLTRLPKALSDDKPASRTSLSLEAGEFTSIGAAPAFGSLRPAGGDAVLHGVLLDRKSRRRAGTVSITPIATDGGMLRVHTLDLQGGSLVAIGAERNDTLTLSSGSGRYAGARGSVTVTSAARSALHFDIELEL